MRRLAPAAVAAFLLAGSLTGPAAAHVCLEHASPRVGARMSAAPAEVRLSFSAPLAVRESMIAMTGPAGFMGGLATHGLAEDQRVLLAPLPASMPPGRYVVRWRAVSGDGHVSQGDFQFEVLPQAAPEASR